MRIRTFLSCLCILFVFVLVSAFPAVAADKTKSSCLKEANGEYQDCVSGCKDALEVDQDTCRNVNHECADACRAKYDTCIQAITDLAPCIAACNSTLSTAEATCHTTSKTPSDLKNCIDGAEQAAILCRADCRVKVQPEFSTCKADFNTCIKACPTVK